MGAALFAASVLDIVEWPLLSHSHARRYAFDSLVTGSS
jgi:hypothetical protein